MSQQPTALNSPAAGNEVDHGYYKCNHQKCVDQIATQIETPSEKPHHQQYRENRPKHMFTWATGEWLNPFEDTCWWGVVPNRESAAQKKSRIWTFKPNAAPLVTWWLESELHRELDLPRIAHALAQEAIEIK